jgi:hypothetical protein
MVVKSYVMIGMFIEMNYEQMIDFNSKIRKNEDIAGYSRILFHSSKIRPLENYHVFI